MSQQQHQQQQGKKPLPGENTYYICVDSEHEHRIAQAYLKQKFPEGTQARLVREIKLLKLDAKHTVIALYRPDGCSPALMAPVDNASGSRGIEPAPMDLVVSEVKEGKPVSVREFWSTASYDEEEGMGDGELVLNTFLGALARTLHRTPAHIRPPRADEKVLRLVT